MYTLITSKFEGNNEINTVEDSRNCLYLERKGTELFEDCEIENAVITDNNKVISNLNLDTCEFEEVENGEIIDMKNFTNEVKFISSDIEVVVTTYTDDIHDGENTFINVDKQLTIKDLKRILKDTFKVQMKNIALDDVKDSEVLYKVEGLTEGSMYNSKYTFDIIF